MISKKHLSFIVTLIALALIIVAISSINLKVSSSTDPYVIGPVSVKPAKISHETFEFDNSKKRLKVFGEGEVFVVADPGESFSYVAIWIANKPKNISPGGFNEFTFDLPDLAKMEHIRIVDKDAPYKIEKYISDLNRE